MKRMPVRAEAIEVKCAFCGGTGHDPFGVLSPLASCSVCGGRGERLLRPPVGECAFCQGTGVYPGSRLTCTSCGGVGQVELPLTAVTCPRCGGSGRACDDLWPDSTLPCGSCGGKGVVASSTA